MNFRIELKRPPAEKKEIKPVVVEQRQASKERPRAEKPKEKPRVESKPPVLKDREAVTDGHMTGIIHGEPVRLPQERDPEMERRDRILREARSQKKEEEEEEPKGFISRLANSRLFKPVAGLFAFAGVAGTIGGGYEMMPESYDTRVEQYKQASDIVLKSPLEDLKDHGFTFSGLPKSTDTVKFSDGSTELRSNLIHDKDVWYTKQISSHTSSLDTLSRTCGEKHKDGSITLDARQCNALYGDQTPLKLDNDAMYGLSAATGYSPEELALEGQILRQSVVRSSQLGLGGASSITEVGRFEDGRQNGDYMNEEDRLFKDRLAFAQDASMHIIRGLDLTNDPHAFEKVKAIQEALKADITLSNDEILIANDIANLTITDVRKTLIPAPGESGHLDLARADEAAAELAWMKVAAYEKDRAGPVHKLAHTLEDVRNDRLIGLLKTGYEAGIDKDFFSAALEEREKPTDVAMK